MTITAAELIDRYEDTGRRDPETALRMVMWLMLYDQRPASWARNFLEEAGVLVTPKDVTERTSQLRKVHRWRTAAEDAAGLPPRGKKGSTQDYRLALHKWRSLNRRPSKDDLLSGWLPQPLPPTSGIEIEDPRATKKSTKAEPLTKIKKNEPAKPPHTQTKGITPRKSAPAHGLVKPEEKSPDKKQKWLLLKKISQDTIP